VYRDPYYSNPDDVPKVAHVYGGRVFNLKADSIKYLPPFKHQTLSSNGIGQPAYRKRSGITSWEYYARPPAAKEMRDWLESELNASSAQRRAARISSQVSPFTPRFSGSCTDWDRISHRLKVQLRSIQDSTSFQQKGQHLRSKRSSIWPF
jgi:hypothetical protein